MDRLADIFGPPPPPALEQSTTGWGWALLLGALVLGALLMVLWRRRAALRCRWLAHALARGRLEPREAARRALQLLRRADPGDAELAERLGAWSYGRDAPAAAAVHAALVRLRRRL